MIGRKSFVRLWKLTTSVSHYFDRLTCPSPTSTPISHLRRHLSPADSPTEVSRLELDRVASPIDGCDYEHWLVVMDPPPGYPLRHQIVQHYIQTLATALGSEEEAKRSLYSVSTKYYYAFGCKISENLVHNIRSLPNVKWVLPDSYLYPGKSDYGGEPFINGDVVPYDETFHEDWLHNQSDSGFRKRRRCRRRGRVEETKECMDNHQIAYSRNEAVGLNQHGVRER